MTPKTTRLIYFSPTRTFKTTLEAIASGIRNTTIIHSDIKLTEAKDFGVHIYEKLAALKNAQDIPKLKVPGSFPYKEHAKRGRISPATREGICRGCETYTSVCPIGAIRVDGNVTTDSDACILCFARVKSCQTGACNEGPGNHGGLPMAE